MQRHIRAMINLYSNIMIIIANDNNITVWHISILFAIIYLSNDQLPGSIINISRSKLRRISHIKKSYDLSQVHEGTTDIRILKILAFLSSKNGK